MDILIRKSMIILDQIYKKIYWVIKQWESKTPILAVYFRNY